MEPGAAPAGESQGGGDHLVDAYVSFGDADRRWVEEELVPRLEAAGRSVFREDQLAPGGIEIEERCRALAASRKTLLVLSRAYLEHRWTIFEEAITLEMDPAARKRRLVPILRDAGTVPLRIRPLVSVDLRGEGEPQQWQRLLEALDPADRPAAGAGPLQRLSLRLAVATSGLSAPSWHPAGTAWLAAGCLAYGLLPTLAYLLWWEMPPLRNSALLLGFLPPAAFALLAWREDRDLFRRLSHLLAGRRLARTAVALLLALAVVTWARAGVPQAREILCGPFGCKEPGTVYVTIAGFETSDPASEMARSWADRSLRNLRLKLAGAGDRVRVLASNLPQIGESDLRRLEVDYTLAGHLDVGGGLPVLAATLWDRNHSLVSPGVEVTGSVDTRHGSQWEVSAEMRRLQDRLAREVLDRLGVELAAGEARRLDGVPTASAAAMVRNAEGFARLTEGRLDAAEAAFREALALDDGYSVAWSNLADTARRAGRDREALAYRRAAVERLPGYAPFHYNLGHTLATLGRHLDALDALETAVELDPSHAPTRNEMGRVLLALGAVDRARRSLEIGLLVDPGSAALHKNLARALVRGDELGEAVAAAEAALALYPEGDWQGRGEATSLLVVAAARSGDDAAACRHLGEVRRLDPDGLTGWRGDAEAALPPGACAKGKGSPWITPPSTATAPLTHPVHRNPWRNPTMARLPLVTLLLPLTLLTGPVEAENPPPPVLSRSEGELRLAGGDRVLVLQAVPWGSTLSLGRGAEAVLVCAGDRAVRLAGPRDWPVEPRACDAGEPVTAGSYSRLQPRPGRVRTFHGHLLAEAPSRSDDQTTKVPVIVSPASPHRRVMAVAGGRPELTWTAVSEALAYDLVLHRDGKEQRASFGILDVKCSADPRTRPAAACTTAWPWAPLREGEEVRLEALARTPDPDWPVRRADPVRLRLADASTRSALAGELASLEGSGPAASPHLQRAAIYQQAGLYNEAAAALAAHLEESPGATVATRLGDLYLGLGLVRAALNHYQHAGNLLPVTGADTVRAEIELGKGRVYARREDPQLAALHLEKALDGFRRLRRRGAVDEVEAELERVRRSLR